MCVFKLQHCKHNSYSSEMDLQVVKDLVNNQKVAGLHFTTRGHELGAASIEKFNFSPCFNWGWYEFSAIIFSQEVRFGSTFSSRCERRRLLFTSFANLVKSTICEFNELLNKVS